MVSGYRPPGKLGRRPLNCCGATGAEVVSYLLSIALPARNLAKAQAALRAPGGSKRSRMNALKHGLFAREFSSATLRRLGEDPQEFREMHRLWVRGDRPY